MKTVLMFAVFEYLLLISFLQHFSLAAPTLQTSEDVAVTSVHTDVKRNVEYRNAQFGAYICRVQKAADLVRAKVNVSYEVYSAKFKYVCTIIH